MNGEEFKRLRLSVGLTRRALAQKLNCSESAIYQWEAGINKMKLIYELALFKIIEDIEVKL